MTPAGEREAPLPGTSSISFWIGLAVVVLSLVSGLATYLILTGLTPIPPRNDVVLLVLMINIVLILAMMAVLGVQAFQLWRAWRQKVAGARVHVRIVALFTVITALPALLLALAATTTFSRSLDNWFSNRTRTIVANSLDVATAYLAEHGQVIRTDIVNMARDLDEAATAAAPDPGTATAWRNLFLAQSGLRELSFAAVIDAGGKVVISTGGDVSVRYEPPSGELLAQAAAGHVPLIMPSDSYRVVAISRLKNYPGHFLYGARRVNAKVVGHMRRTEAGVAEYERLRRARGGLKLVHGVMYFMISLTGVLAAIWVGLWFATQLVAPIRRLIGAAQQVAKGNLSVELPLNRGEGDLRRLSRDFNHMTRELDRQRGALIAANDQLNERRRFIEAMLSGVTAGVIGLDANDRIRLVNPSAERLLAREHDTLVGRTLQDVLPEIARHVAGPLDPGHHKTRTPEPISLQVGEDERIFAVQMTREDGAQGGQGSVLTFDDITELVSAQRTSAWGDVARRIAHEIKNPLTPIQLSAERIRRKYGAHISDDRATFDKLIETIIRQVGDIKTMVDEFAAFARVPKPEFGTYDVREAVQEAVILFRESHPSTLYDMQLPPAPVMASCDRRLLTQALTNLVKNATEAVEGTGTAETAVRPAGWKGRVRAEIAESEDAIEIRVSDNGPGLPKHNRSRLLEPYVTTKGSKGTGLGLAIVQKIIEQHGGTLSLEDVVPSDDAPTGALVRINIPRRLRGQEKEGGAAAASDFDAHGRRMTA